MARIRGPSAVRAAQKFCNTVSENIQSAVAAHATAKTQRIRDGHTQDSLHPEKRSADVDYAILQENVKRRPNYSKVPTFYT